MTHRIITLIISAVSVLGCGTARLEERIARLEAENRQLREANTPDEDVPAATKETVSATAGNRQQMTAGNGHPVGYGQPGYRAGVAPAFVVPSADAYTCTLDTDENAGGGRRLKITNNTPWWIAPKIDGRPVIMTRGMHAQRFAVLAPGQSCYAPVMSRRRHDGQEIARQLSANAYWELPISADPEHPILNGNRDDWTKTDQTTNFLLSITIGAQHVRHFVFNRYHFHG